MRPFSVTDSAGSAAGIGVSLKRNEDERFLNGQGSYLADLRIAGTRDLAFVRSPIAHGRLQGIRIEQADRELVFTAADLPDMAPIIARATAPGYRVSEHPALAVGKVRFVGEAVAVCLGSSRADAEDRAQRVELDLEDLSAVVDMFDAQHADVERVHESWPDNVALESRISAGDFEQACQAAPIVVERQFRMNRHAAVSLEGRGVLAWFDARQDQLVVYSSTQFPHVLRTALARAVGLAERRLRVIAPDVGGGFGVKSNLHPEEIVTAAVALRVRHPVRWIEDRREHLLASQHAREHRYRVIGYADRDGRLLAVDAEVTVDAGAYSVWPWTSTMEAGMAAGMIPGPYRLAAYRARVRTIATNKSPLGPYRGVGRTGACLAIECLIDEVARELGREPHEIRRLNMVDPAAMPFTSLTGKRYDSGDYPASVEIAARMIDLEGVRRRQQTRSDGCLLGVGLACYVEQTAHGTAEWTARGLPVNFGYEPATATLMPDGGLVLAVGIQCHGQGLETTLAQIASEILGVDPTRVSVRHGDTAQSPYGMGTVASRGMVMAGGAVAKACQALGERLRRIGAHLLDVPLESTRISAGRVLGDGRAIDFAEIGEVAHLRLERLPPGESPGLSESAVYEPAQSTGAFSYGTHAVAVAVDPDTGTVTLLDYVAVHDCGTVVNPMIVEGQLAGGIAQGIGTALFEEIPYDGNGQPLASTFMDYLLPGAPEMPEIRLAHMNTPSPHTAFGIKGMGEGGAIAPPAAILNAVNDALRQIGARLGETPITPRRVFAAVTVARSAA